MRIVIAGPGAMGCLLAARMSAVLWPGDELALLDHRHDRARRLNRDGFALEDGGKTRQLLLPTTADSTTISGCDLFFLCTRTESVSEALHQAEPLLSPATLLIGIQRGISHLQPLQDSTAIAAAAVTSADVFLNPDDDRIQCLDPGRMQIGLLDERSQHTRLLDQAIDLLGRAGLNPENKPDIMVQIWDSFFIDLAVNAPAAIYRRPNGQLLTSCSVRGNIKKLLNEAIEIRKAVGIPTGDDPARVVFQLLRTERNRIAPMLRDIQNSHPTEIDALNGSIVEMGKQLAVPTPTNEDFVMRIKRMEGKYDP